MSSSSSSSSSRAIAAAAAAAVSTDQTNFKASMSLNKRGSNKLTIDIVEYVPEPHSNNFQVETTSVAPATTSITAITTTATTVNNSESNSTKRVLFPDKSSTETALKCDSQSDNWLGFKRPPSLNNISSSKNQPEENSSQQQPLKGS